MDIYEKVTKIGGFAWYSGFLHELQMASQDLATMWQKKRRKAKFQMVTPHANAYFVQDFLIIGLKKKSLKSQFTKSYFVDLYDTLKM